MLNEIFHEKKKKLLVIVSIFLIATLTISMINEISAADITIGPNTPGGLKQAVKSAQDGDTIYLQNGVYSGEGNSNIGPWDFSKPVSEDYEGIGLKSITIKGLGSNVVIDGKGKNQFMSFVTVWDEFGLMSLSIENIKFINGYSSNRGGAINFMVPGKLTIKNCVFTNNKAKDGGAIAGSADGLEIINCKFENNIASAGNGGAVDAGGSINKITISQSTFTNNKATNGGAISHHWGGHEFHGGKFLVSNCKFNNNKAVKLGEAIYYGSYHAGTVSTSTFTNNKKNSIYNDQFEGKECVAKNCVFDSKATSTSTNTLKVLTSKATVRGTTVAVSVSLDKSKSKTGNTVVKLKTPANIAYRNFKVSLGSATYNQKTKVLAWTIKNNQLAKKSATLNWNLKANKKGNYKITPSISSSGNTITNKKNISFKV